METSATEKTVDLRRAFRPGPVIVLLLVVFAVCFLNRMRLESAPYSSDQAYIATLVLKYRQPDLFPGDPGLLLMAYYPKSYIGLVDLLSAFAGGTKQGLFGLGCGLLLLFAAGMYLLLFDATRSRWTAVVVAVASMWLRASFGGSNWEVASLSSYIPRTITLAMLPWLFLACRRSLGRWQLVAVFGALGLAANFHPLSSMQMAMVFGLALLLVPAHRLRHVAMLTVSVAVFWTAAAPYVFEVRGAKRVFAHERPTDLREPTRDEIESVMRDRLPSHFFPPWRTFRWVGFHMLLPALCGGVGYWLRRRSLTPADRLVPGFLIAVVIVSFGGILALALLRSGFGFQKSLAFMRVFKLAYLPLWIGCGWLIVELWNRGGGGARTVAALVGAALLVPASAPEYAVRWVKYGGKVPKPTSVETDPDFQAVCAWIQENTPRDARFLVDPNFHLFRVFARRTMVATRKEISLVILDAAVGVDAFKRWHDVWAAYQKGSAEALMEVAKRYSADYIVVVDLVTPEAPVFRSRSYAVYRVGGG